LSDALERSVAGAEPADCDARSLWEQEIPACGQLRLRAEVKTLQTPKSISKKHPMRQSGPEYVSAKDAQSGEIKALSRLTVRAGASPTNTEPRMGEFVPDAARANFFALEDRENSSYR
jgi:hypothetical protein